MNINVVIEMPYESSIELISLFKSDEQKIKDIYNAQIQSIMMLPKDRRGTAMEEFDSGKGRVLHEFFIGRNDELSQIRQFLTPESEHQLLEIYTNGAGGIGKTSLLEKTLASCLEKTDQFIATQEFIDFYHTACRSRIGVLQELARTLDNQSFPKFSALASTYLQEPDPSKRKKNLSDIEKAFIREYTSFCQKSQGKTPVLFFDTYEFIQRTLVPGQRQAENTGLSRWIETKLWPALLEAVPATRIIVSGRYPLKDISRLDITVMPLELEPFEIDDTTEFLQKRFNVDNVVDRIGSAEDLQKIQAISNGHPILLALFVDWVTYTKNPLSPHELIASIEAETSPIFPLSLTLEHRAAFERFLIERVTALKKPEDTAVIYMAVAYHRMTPDMFQALLSDEVSDLQCQAIFEQLQNFSFVKQKAPDILLLHDEMRRMVVNWLNKYFDKSRLHRKELAKALVQYYDTLLQQTDLSDTEREIYTTERIEYSLLADSEKGLTRFREEFEQNFDMYIDAGRYDYCDMLLRDAEMIRLENPKVIPFPDHVILDWRRIQYINDAGGDPQEAIALANTILQQYQDEPNFRKHRIYGHILMQRGIAEFLSEQFEPAKASLHEASKVFHHQRDPIALYTCRRWIGYVNYRQSNFDEAEHYYNQSREGFYEHIDDIANMKSDVEARKVHYRSLLQAIQLSFGNLAILYHYLGRVEHAIPYAEIALEIARALPENAVEIARIRATLGRVFTGIGRSIDARHHLRAAQDILQDVEEPLLEGRVNTDLGILSYRGSEFERILEYYRADEISNIIKNYAPNAKELDQAERYIKKAIDQAGEEKEQSDAFYASGELYMVMPSPDHWQRAEEAFVQALTLARKSDFEYRIIDTLESLVTLYYFWQRPGSASASYQKDLDQFHQKNPNRYPDLFAKYSITLGDAEYDRGCACLDKNDYTEETEIAPHFTKAFGHYRNAISLMHAFHADAYYGVLGLFYNRLRTLVDKYHGNAMLSRIFTHVREAHSWMSDADETVSLLYTYVHILIEPTESSLQKAISDLQQTIQGVLDKGNFGRALLLTDCLLGMYRAALRLQPDNVIYREELIFHLRAKAVYYRRLGNTSQARRYLKMANDELTELKSLSFKHLPHDFPTALEGSLKATEGTLLYRQGGYEQMLEFYLREELDVARRKFDDTFDKPGEPKVRAQAFQLLAEGEEMLHSVITAWKQRSETGVEHDRLLKRYHAQLGETRFRLGELLMLDDDFVTSPKLQERVFGYFEQAIADAEASEYAYLRENARQSWHNALYFSGITARDASAKEQQHLLEEQVECMAHSDGQTFPSVMGKFRITQGDILFSKHFQYRDRQEKEGKFHDYVHPGPPIESSILLEMLEYYVEACDFMAQHGSQDFSAAFRTLQRRIELIADVGVLQEIHDELRGLWNIQEHLSHYTEELQTLRQFAQLRSIILEYGIQN